MNYRKKPVMIEAFQYFDDMGTHTAVIPRWFIDATVSGTVYCKGKETYIKTLEGDHRVSDGDFVIQGVKGELYPCKPDIFAATYDDASEKVSEGQLPAFPTENEHQSGSNTFHYSGVTIRDYFAAQTLAGLVPVWNDRGSTFAGDIAKSAYEIADAMLAERAKK